MERHIQMKGDNYLIKGNWQLQGMSINFTGEVLKSESNKVILAIEFSVPFSFRRKFGQGAMEEEIVLSVKEYLEQEA